MNPSARLSVALLLALVVWLPSLNASMKGEIDLSVAAVRYLVAFLLARLAVNGVAKLLDTYARTPAEVPVTDDAEHLQRRADDVAARLS
jgi:hypothetical protein